MTFGKFQAPWDKSAYFPSSWDLMTTEGCGNIFEYSHSSQKEFSTIIDNDNQIIDRGMENRNIFTAFDLL